MPPDQQITDDRSPALAIRSPWLNWSDQVACAGLLAGALALLAWHSHPRAGLRRYDRTVRLPATSSLRFHLEINQADWPEWLVLPGIGPALAQRITATRQSLGGFKRREDLLQVPGIGPRLYERMSEYLVVSEPWLDSGKPHHAPGLK